MSLTKLGRRAVVKSLTAGLPLAAVLADPKLARAASAGLETVAIDTAGGHQVRAALAMPGTLPAPAIMLIHEWWGLNDQIKAVAAKFAALGYMGLAVDLFGGKTAGSSEEAQALVDAVAPEVATETLVAWLRWLKEHEQATGSVAVIGWCFGGTWALNASVAEPVDATVIYYGQVNKPAAQLAQLRGPVLGHFATRDQWINAAMVSAFEAAMREADRPYTTHWYDAEHAFANPTGARYDAADADLAWSRTTAFLDQHLGPDGP